MTGIAQFLKVVVNVSDLQSGLKFWSALTGLEPGYIDPLGNFAGLGSVPVVGEVVSSVILLQLVPKQQTPVHSGAHVDLFTDAVSRAVEQASAIGATLVRPAGFYPDHDPMLSDEKPLLEWAVMADPFGNEFCLVTHA